MSNSSLVNFTLISPNSSERVYPITKITPHHMAGNLTVESCGAVFQNTSREASSNYGIGTDGRIGLYVPEDRRAWTSSNWDNDNRAVTIEVANSYCGGDWPVSDAAWNSLVNLCVDICRRNGIKGLSWTGDSSGSLTCHYMFASTGCPGPYLKSKMGQLANEVNAKLNNNTSVTKENDLKNINIPQGNYPVYRLYNKHGGGHLFTSSKTEYDNLVRVGWTGEGEAWTATDSGAIAYRMYNPNNGQHFYTTSYTEADKLQKAGWQYEGANFASARSGKSVYRLYNKYDGDHMWTTSENEKNNLVKGGWTYEGVGFYAV